MDLRRFDHSAIFLLIAAPTRRSAVSTRCRAKLDAGTCHVAGCCLRHCYKFFPRPLRPSRISGLSRLGLSQHHRRRLLPQVLPPFVEPVIAGGLLYTAGSSFYIWESLKLQCHLARLCGRCCGHCHFAAITNCTTDADFLSRTHASVWSSALPPCQTSWISSAVMSGGQKTAGSPMARLISQLCGKFAGCATIFFGSKPRLVSCRPPVRVPRSGQARASPTSGCSAGLSKSRLEHRRHLPTCSTILSRW